MRVGGSPASDAPSSDVPLTAVGAAVRGGAARGAQADDLVTARSLADAPDGSELTIADGARVTALAEEEAWRRGIRLVSQTRRSTQGGPRRVAVGSDHGGFAAKRDVLAWITELGHLPLDLGTHDENPVDYPDTARAVAEAVAAGRADLGVCLDGAGIGSAIAANKVPGILAATCWNEASARNAREHNFANLLCAGARMLERGELAAIVRAFLATPTGAERHARRVDKIRAIETHYHATGESAHRR